MRQSYKTVHRLALLAVSIESLILLAYNISWTFSVTHQLNQTHLK
jgi:hypothetical protein